MLKQLIMQPSFRFLRWVFGLCSIALVTLILWQSALFYKQLKENERGKMQLWAAAQQALQENLANDPNQPASDAQLLLNILRQNKTTPMFLFTHKEQVYEVNNMDASKITDTIERAKIIARFKEAYDPIEIKYKGEVLQTIYYGHAAIITKIKYYPAALILVIAMFFLAIYFFYKTTRVAEQNKLWAGMAKETAHQIGTPLSSLVGWMEILKDQVQERSYLEEMQQDIERLKTITGRFSKIGSTPTLTIEDAVQITKTTMNYLEARSSKLIEFKVSLPDAPIKLPLNVELISWTLENLVKNGIDAMKGKGTISVTLIEKNKSLFWHISDEGHGIPKRLQTQIFKPGFTTKKRGWGLGLSLAKRIVQTYHKGRIKVLKSNKEGTTIEVSLRLPT